MEHYDTTGRQSAHQSVVKYLRARASVVGRVISPQRGCEAKLSGDTEDIRAKLSSRGPAVAGLHSGDPLDYFVGRPVLGHNLDETNVSQRRVAVAMIGHSVSILIDGPDQFGVLLCHESHHKKGCNRILFFEDLQELWRRRWMRAIIKREGDHLIRPASVSENVVGDPLSIHVS